MSKNLLFFIVGNAVLIALTYFTRKKTRLNNIFLTCTTVFLFLSIVETVYRNFFRPAPPPVARGYELTFRPDSLLGHQIAATGAAYTIVADSIGNYVYHHRIGFSTPRASEPPARVSPPDPGLVFLGCSFTFGQGVSDSETMPFRVGALRRRPTLNLGEPGYGIHQVYRIFMDKYAGTDNSHRLFIYTFLADHVLRAAGLYDFSAGPGYQLVGDSLEYAGPLPAFEHRAAYYVSLGGCFSLIKDRIIAIQDAYRARRIPATEYQKAYLMIRNMARYASASGGHFVLLFWDALPFRNDPNFRYQDLLDRQLAQLKHDGVEIIRVSDLLDTRDPGYYIPHDNHPNARAYDTVARWLAEHLPFPQPQQPLAERRQCCDRVLFLAP